MLIRKKFKFEMAHVVRNAWSQRCAKSIHGHSYVVEFILKGDKLDSAGMVVDFGLVKKYLNDFVDSFDHATCLWNLESEKETIKFFKENFSRVIVMPITSSAEQQAKLFLKYSNYVIEYLKATFPEYVNDSVEMYSVRVHETKTGWAEAFQEDLKNEIGFSKPWFSEDIKSEWKEKFTKEFFEEESTK